ncbi:kappa-type opioid receptor-like [Asterias rubens]|uniref:kappa-type opioid receptor-like n=1 Tax=Asterias rubens TaxID=7604 RepID=UPI0014550F2F|nr:kappa-type opioid receptor-like [Asterias rubens]
MLVSCIFTAIDSDSECSSFQNISEEMLHRWIFRPEDRTIITIFIPIIWGLGVIINCTFLFMIYRIPKLRTETNVYLTHLALADLLYLNLFSAYDIWRYVASPVADNVPFTTSTGCLCFIIAINMGYFAAMALVTMVSFERYLSLCHPIKHLKIRGRRRTKRMVAFCWLVGFVFAVTSAPERACLNKLCLQWPESEDHQGYPHTRASCDPVTPWVESVTQPLLNVPWLIAMVANIFMYVRIVQMLHRRKSSHNGKFDHHQTAMKLRNQVAKMLIVNGAVFFVCQTPNTLLSLTRWTCLIAQIPNPLDAALGNTKLWIALIPQRINTIVNPLIYGAINSQYQTAFRQTFMRKGKSKKPDSANAISSPKYCSATNNMMVNQNCNTDDTTL